MANARGVNYITGTLSVLLGYVYITGVCITVHDSEIV